MLKKPVISTSLNRPVPSNATPMMLKKVAKPMSTNNTLLKAGEKTGANAMVQRASASATSPLAVKSGAAPPPVNGGEKTSATATVPHQAVKPDATPTVGGREMVNRTVTPTSLNRPVQTKAIRRSDDPYMDWILKKIEGARDEAIVQGADAAARVPNPTARYAGALLHPSVAGLVARVQRDQVRTFLDDILALYLKIVPENYPLAITVRNLNPCNREHSTGHETATNEYITVEAATNIAYDEADRRRFERQEEKINASSSNATHTFFSTGESFADGATIELISGSSKPNLLLWNGRKANVGPRIEHGGCTYEAPELDPILWRAMRLPAGCRDYGSARGLFDGVRDLFQRYLSLPESESGLIACFAISTWLADRLPSAPNLRISGPDEELGIDVLRLLSCVCRHPLMLAELTADNFRSLPMHLSLTLLLDQQRLKPNLQRLLRASSYRGLHLPGHRGNVVDLYGPKAIFCGNDAAADTLCGGVIRISLAPSRSPLSVADVQLQNKIANHFQPRLLTYRLQNSRKVGNSRVDLSNLTFATRPLARTLAGCFPQDSDLARDTVHLLQSQDEEIREQRFRDVNCVIVEILWGMIHGGKRREARVDELARDANALLQSRGEILEYSAEEVGWKLHDLNIPRHTSSSGRQVLLGRETNQRVHRLAQAYDLPCSHRIEVNCPDCNQAKATAST